MFLSGQARVVLQRDLQFLVGILTGRCHHLILQRHLTSKTLRSGQTKRELRYFLISIMKSHGTCFKTKSKKILNCYENYLNLLSRYRRYIRRVSGSRSIIFSTTKAIFRVLALIQPAECEKTSRHPCRYLFFFNFIYSLV